jgi:GntR family transcriptional regulator/MocR family aminotransferase
MLAESLSISRATVTASFAHLQSEGYLEAAIGSGTFVSTELPDEPAARSGTAAEPAQHESFRLSAYGASLERTGALEPPRIAGNVDFRDGRPAFDAFPYHIWRRLVARAIREGGRRFDYAPDPAGHPPLREAIAAYLGRVRAVECTADDVVIVTGSQQAIDLTARILIEPGDIVAIEEPGYRGAQRTFAAQGAELCGVRVDNEGMRVDELAACGPVRLVYVTPSHQFPTGVVLSLARRLELLRWASRARAVVFEDDYDSAYRYGGAPIAALQGLDTDGRVVYVGTFSKTMFPALRIGYVVIPAPLRHVFVQAKAFCDRQSPIVEQCALADFLNEGHFERHVRRMRALYRSRREVLLAALRRHAGDVEVIGDSAGMHLMARLPVDDDDRFVARAAKAGVTLATTRSCYLDAPRPHEFIFGFAEVDEAAIDAGVARLAEALL